MGKKKYFLDGVIENLVSERKLRQDEAKKKRKEFLVVSSYSRYNKTRDLKYLLKASGYACGL